MGKNFSLSDPGGWEERQKRKDYENTTEYRLRFTNDPKTDRSRKRLEEQSTESSENIIFDNPSYRQEFSELSSDFIMNVFWNKVFYYSTLDGPATTTTNNNEVFTLATRQALTYNQLYRYSDRPCRFRASVYFNADGDQTQTYIGTGGTSTLETGITSINQEEMEYVAVYFEEGNVKIKAKNFDGTTEKETQFTIDDSDKTYLVEIDYYPKERADFYLDKEYLGSITENLPTGVDAITYFPFMVSLQRISATNKTFTVEAYEFIQPKQ